MESKTIIIATIGPASSAKEVLSSLINHHMNMARLNFSWGDLNTRMDTISIVRKMEQEIGIHIPFIIDLPGPRVQAKTGHTYDHDLTSAITEHDKEFIKFGIEHGVNYFAVSFVGTAADILECKKIIEHLCGKQKVIAKI